MIALLVISAIGMGITRYLKKTASVARDSQGTEENRQKIQMISKLLREDLQQAVYLNPSCTTNAAPNSSSPINTPCSDIQVRAGIQPYPGTNLSTIDALSVLTPPANLESATNALGVANDSLRILRYDFTGSFNCRLNRSTAVRPTNPSQTSGTGSGAERLWADSTCNGLLSVGGLYVITEVFDTDLNSTASTDLVPYSNLFQITALTDTGSDLQIDAASSNNRFNQVGGLGRSGYSNKARIYPVKFIEWSYDDGSGSQAAGLYRREIDPTSANLLGYGSWKLIDPTVIGLQFYPLTVTTTTPVVHQRTMQFDGNVNNNGLEDIKGVSPRIVIQGDKIQSTEKTFDNPLTSAVETGKFPISDTKFFVEMRNTEIRN